MPTVKEYEGTRFSKAFNLTKAQSQLDFVDIYVDQDMPLFIDPFAIKQRTDQWSIAAARTLQIYFAEVVDRIRANELSEARQLLTRLSEPNEIHFGLSENGSKGAGIGSGQAEQIFQALKNSSAVKTGFLNELEDCELLVDGVGRDKISDLTANVIRMHLIEYTRQQCCLHDIKMQEVAMPPYFDPSELCWKSEYGLLPVFDDRLIILVPKIIARYKQVLNHLKYYNGFVLNYLQVEELNANGSLVRALKNGERRVDKKRLKKKFPCSKDFLLKFSQRNPAVLEQYKNAMAKKALVADDIENDGSENILAKILIDALLKIEPGTAKAYVYQDLMLGIVELIFHPHLTNPVKEQDIHDGRKRVDIVMDNAAHEGIFERLHSKFGMPVPYVFIECKNYSRDLANPELDQIAGRFSHQRGQVGIILCRAFKEFDVFIQRCIDTYKDKRGLILLLDDNRIIELLRCISIDARAQAEKHVEDWFREILLP